MPFDIRDVVGWWSLLQFLAVSYGFVDEVVTTKLRDDDTDVELFEQSSVEIIVQEDESPSAAEMRFRKEMRTEMGNFLRHWTRAMESRLKHIEEMKKGEGGSTKCDGTCVEAVLKTVKEEMRRSTDEIKKDFNTRLEKLEQSPTKQDASISASINSDGETMSGSKLMFAGESSSGNLFGKTSLTASSSQDTLGSKKDGDIEKVVDDYVDFELDVVGSQSVSISIESEHRTEDPTAMAPQPPTSSEDKDKDKDNRSK